MNLNDLCDCIHASIGNLMNPRMVGNKFQHQYVEAFQDALKDCLNTKCSGTFKWSAEYKDPSRIENDSIDIYGEPKTGDDSEWIIEIDATRSDQVAKKMLSRFALWGFSKKPVTYIAILYPDTSEGRNPSKKYIRYGNSILKKINKNSRVIGIILGKDIKKRTPSSTNSAYIVDDEYIEIYDPNNKLCFDIQYKSANLRCVKGMDGCAQNAIVMYGRNKPTTTYADLITAFGKYIATNSGPSRYSPTRLSLSGNLVYTYTQFRRYGNWLSFVSLCKKLKINIDELSSWYTARASVGGGFQYDKNYVHY